MTSPRSRRCAALGEVLASIGLKLPKAGRAAAGPVQPHPARASQGSEHQLFINEVVLRSQSQAEYAAENYGHFGLNLRRYAHFTSPIRRYADLIVHRALIRALKLGKDGLPARHDAWRSWSRSAPGSPPPSAAPWRRSGRPSTG